jgi:GMP reductase
MRIESDVKLDFKDVLLRPKRSTLGSRANVDLERFTASVTPGLRWR